MTTTNSLCALVLLAAVGCATDEGDSDSDGRNDHVAPLGTYSADPTEAGLLDPNDHTFLAELTLRDDGTFHALLAEPLRYFTCRLDQRDSRTDCGWENEGVYSFRSGKLKLAFETEQEYAVSWRADGRLELRNTATRRNEVLVVAETNYCAEVTDCEAQGAECSGSWSCEENNSCACNP